MKKLLLLLLFIPIVSISQQITVKTQGSYLNLRESPTLDCKVIEKLENNQTVGYSGQWEEGWIKVNIFKRTGHLTGKRIEGWVSSDYVTAPNFKSRILEKIDDNNSYIQSQFGRGWPVWENVDGMILIHGWDDIIIQISGKYIKLKERENDGNNLFTEYYNDEISIKIFDILTAEYYETNHFKGIMIINYNGIEELIFVSLIY